MEESRHGYGEASPDGLAAQGDTKSDRSLLTMASAG